MIDAARRNQRSQACRFWLRCLLVVGILWGFLPFVTAPYIARGVNDSFFDVLASVVNSLTVLPACALAFWHRRTACVWLSVNAVLLAIALATYLQRTRRFDAGMILQVIGPIAIALCLDFMEIRRCPGAVDPRPARP